MRVETVLTPAEIAALGDLSGEVCVVFDVLRATSSMVTAVASGAERIFAVATIEEARALHKEYPDALLGGERGGDKIPGFDLGNSPSEYTGCRGRTIISTTTNGTLALAACRSARATCAAAFLNLQATADWILAQNPRIVRLVCAGTRADFSFEDGLAAGAFAEALGADDLADATAALRDLFRLHRADWQECVRHWGNGRDLVAAGRGDDITWAMRRDVFPVVVTRQGDAFAAAQR